MSTLFIYFFFNFISLEISGCLVFIGFDFARFGVTVVKISCPKRK